jgi:hypothetical protein
MSKDKGDFTDAFIYFPASRTCQGARYEGATLLLCQADRSVVMRSPCAGAALDPPLWIDSSVCGDYCTTYYKAVRVGGLIKLTPSHSLTLTGGPRPP